MCCSHCHGSVGSFAGTQHFRKALGIFDLILHMVEILKHGEMTVGIGFHHSIPVFEMLLEAAELEKCSCSSSGNTGNGLSSRLHSIWRR